jgi:hypothetical protein
MHALTYSYTLFILQIGIVSLPLNYYWTVLASTRDVAKQRLSRGNLRTKHILLTWCFIAGSTLERVSIKNVTYQRIHDNQIEVYPVTQKMIMKMVRHHPALKWLRSDMAENVSILQQKRGRISRLSVTKVERFKYMWLKNGFIMYMLKRGTGSSLRACVDRFTFALDVARHLPDTPTCGTSYSQLGSYQVESRMSWLIVSCQQTTRMRCQLRKRIAAFIHRCTDRKYRTYQIHVVAAGSHQNR